jgi:acid phosphatase (class A)
MTTAKDFLYQQFMDDPDIIPPEGKTKEELVEELVDQKLRQSRNNSRAFELLSKDAGGGYDIATYSWDKSTKKVQEPWVDEKELEKAVPDKYGEPTKGQLKLLHRPFKVLTGSLDDFELEPPPENDSETTQRELKFVRTAAKFAEENPERFEGIDVEDRNLLTPFLDFLASENLSVDEEYLKNVLSDVATIAMYWKFKYNRPRPYQYKGMTERKNESADTPSYPSGHSLQAKVAADILSNAYPEHAEELQYIGKNIGRNRIMGGWHFPSDHAAGRDLADQIIEKLPKNVDMFLKKSPLGEDDYMAAIRSSMQKHAEDFNIPVQKDADDSSVGAGQIVGSDGDSAEQAAKVQQTEGERRDKKEQMVQFTMQYARKLFNLGDDVSDKQLRDEANQLLAEIGTDDGKFADRLVRMHHSTAERTVGLEPLDGNKDFERPTADEVEATKKLIDEVQKEGRTTKGLNHPDLETVPDFVSTGSTLQAAPKQGRPKKTEEGNAGKQTPPAPKATQEPKAEAAPQPKTSVAETTSQPETASEPEAPVEKPQPTQTTTTDKKPAAKKTAAKKPAAKEPEAEVESPPEQTVQEEPKVETTEEASTEPESTAPVSFRQERLAAKGDDVLSQLIDENHEGYHTLDEVKRTLRNLPDTDAGKKSFRDKLAEAEKLHSDKLTADERAAQAEQDEKAPPTGFTASAEEVEEIRNRLRREAIKDVVDEHIKQHVTRHGSDAKYKNMNSLARHLAELPSNQRMKQMDAFNDSANKLREKMEREEAAKQRREATQKEKDEKTQRVADFNSELESLPRVTPNSTQHDKEEVLRETMLFESKHEDTLSDPNNSKLKASLDKHRNDQFKAIRATTDPATSAKIEENIKAEVAKHGADFGGDAHRSEIEGAKKASESKNAEHETFLNTVGNQRMKHSVFANRDDHQQTSTFTANDQAEIDEARQKGKTDDEIKQDRISRGLPPGSPPRPGLQWHKETHRWINPDIYKDVGNVLKAGESVHIADPASLGLAHHVDTTPDGGILAHKDENGSLNIYSALAANKNKFGHHAPDHENQPHGPSEEQHARSNAAAHLVSSGQVSMSSAELTKKLGIAQATSALESWHRERQGQLYGKYLKGAAAGAAVGALAGPAGAVVGAALGAGLAYSGIKNRKDFTRDAIADKMISTLGSKATDATLTAVEQFRTGSTGSGSVGKLANFVRDRGPIDRLTGGGVKFETDPKKQILKPSFAEMQITTREGSVADKILSPFRKPIDGGED